MADETVNNTNAEKVTDKSSAEKKAEPAKDSAGVDQAYLARLQDAEAKLNKLNDKYKTDPNFKKAFDASWSGKYELIADLIPNKKEQASAEKEVSEDPISRLEQSILGLKKENEELKKGFQNLGGALQNSEVSRVRTDINSNYYKTFERLAAAEGYEAGTDAFEILFERTQKEGDVLCRKFGLVDEDGSPDPLITFKPEMIRESFENAHKKIKNGLGYDAQAKAKESALKRKQEQIKAEEAKVDHVLKPENLKTPSGRAKAYEQALRMRLKDKGINMNDFRLT